MWIQVRTFDGKKTVKVKGLSKLTKVEELRESIKDKFDAEPSQQQLFYRGKLVSFFLLQYKLGFIYFINVLMTVIFPNISYCCCLLLSSGFGAIYLFFVYEKKCCLYF